MLEPLLDLARSRRTLVMLDSATITRTTRGTFDTTTGTYALATVTLWSGFCWVKLPADLSPRPREVGDRRVSLLQYNIEIAHDQNVSAVRRGDLVTVTGYPVLEVVELSGGTTSMSWTLACEEAP